MVGPRLSQDEEYLKAVKDHILGMIVTTRVQFLVPDCLKRSTKYFPLNEEQPLTGAPNETGILADSLVDWLRWALGGICTPRARSCSSTSTHGQRNIVTRWQVATVWTILHRQTSRYALPGNSRFVSPAPEKSNKSSGWLAEHSQVEIFRWLYESSVLRQRWTYNEVIGEILLLQFAFIYTTAYVRDSQVHGSGKST